MPANGPFSSEEDGGNFRRLFEECLRQARLSPRALHHQLLRDTREDVPEKTIASWRRPHSTTGRLVVPTEATAHVVARWLTGRDGVSVTEEELLGAWRADKAAQAARREDRRTAAGDATAVRGLDAIPHNLPVQLNRFIGRDVQMEQLRQVLTANRQCTLTGAGGVGKTRLALQVARELLERFGDGVWVVDLTSTPGPQALAQTVISALGVREGGTGTYTARAGGGRRRSDTERLVEHLRSRQVLVVLDNCEHLVEPCAALVEALLRACAGLKVLCTSRERLGIEGEIDFRVPPLAFPPPDEALTEEETAGFESVRLFLDRAAHRRPELRPTAEDIRAVGEICRRVDGSALAIELAAARVRLLAPAQILELLDDRLTLLSSGLRTAPPRHQTLRAMIDWSHDDLSPSQRMLLRRLSVFVGGFELAAAQHVAAGDGLDRSDVLHLLGTLVDKSLVETDQHAGAIRYRLLETIRSYSTEKLDDCGERDVVAARHQDWYLAVAEEAESGLTGAEQRRWLDLLEADHDNLRAALAYGGAGDDTAEKALRLAAALGQFWLIRGFLTEGRQHLEETLARVKPAPTTLRAKALAVAGHLAMFDSDIDIAALRSEEALALSRQVGYRRGEAWALRTLGRVASGRERFAEAGVLQQRALALSRELGDDWGTGFLLTNVGNLALLAGRFDEASAAYEESLAVRRRIRDDWGQIWSLFRLGVLRTWQGRFHEARDHLGEALRLSERLRYGAGTVLALLALGECEHLVDDQAGAEIQYAEAHTVAHDLEDPTGISLSVVGLASVAIASGDPDAARRWLGAEERERATGTRSTHAAWLRAEARLARACGDHQEAVELHRTVLGLRRRLADSRALTESLEDLGVLYVEGGAPDRGAVLLATAAASRWRMGAPVPPLLRDDVERARAAVPVGMAPPPRLLDAVDSELAGPSATAASGQPAGELRIPGQQAADDRHDREH